MARLETAHSIAKIVMDNLQLFIMRVVRENRFIIRCWSSGVYMLHNIKGINQRFGGTRLPW